MTGTEAPKSAADETAHIFAILRKPDNELGDKDSKDMTDVASFICEGIKVSDFIKEEKLKLGPKESYEVERTWSEEISSLDSMINGLEVLVLKFCAQEAREHCKDSDELDKRLKALSDDFEEFEAAEYIAGSESSKE